MSTQGINNTHYNYVNNTGTHHAAKGEKTPNQEEAKTAATEQQTAENTTSVQQKSETYKPDMDKIREMKASLKGNIDAFKKMVYQEVKGQGNNANSALQDILKNISGTTQEEAAAAVADDGYWGVEATATRILDFAKAISGGDPSKIETLKNAVQKGFEAAGKVWGGELPEISQKTLAKIMEGFDDWANSGNATTAQAQAGSAIQ